MPTQLVLLISVLGSKTYFKTEIEALIWPGSPHHPPEAEVPQ